MRQKNINLAGLSSVELEKLAKRAASLAADLKAKEPSYALALEAGIEDRSYNTVRYGRVARFAGEAEIVMDNGAKWLAKGHGPRGTAEHVSREGYIEFLKIEDEVV